MVNSQEIGTVKSLDKNADGIEDVCLVGNVTDRDLYPVVIKTAVSYWSGQ